MIELLSATMLLLLLLAAADSLRHRDARGKTCPRTGDTDSMELCTLPCPAGEGESEKPSSTTPMSEDALLHCLRRVVGAMRRMPAPRELYFLTTCGGNTAACNWSTRSIPGISGEASVLEYGMSSETRATEHLPPAQLAPPLDGNGVDYTAWWQLPGLEFNPTDRELVVHYLKNKVLERELPPHHKIKEMNVYDYNADDVPLDIKRGSEETGYFFVRKELRYNNGCFHTAPGGYWKIRRPRRPTRHGGRVIAFKTRMRFYRGRAPHGSKTVWTMSEYTLNTDMADLRNSIDPAMNALVVCKVRKRQHAAEQPLRSLRSYRRTRVINKDHAWRPKATVVRRVLGQIAPKIGKRKRSQL